MKFPLKTDNKITMYSEIPLLFIQIIEGMCTYTFIRVEMWEQPKCPFIDKQVKKMW